VCEFDFECRQAAWTVANAIENFHVCERGDLLAGGLAYGLQKVVLLDALRKL